MEPTNHPFRKEHDLPNLHEDMFHVHLHGCRISYSTLQATEVTLHEQQHHVCAPEEKPFGTKRKNRFVFEIEKYQVTQNGGFFVWWYGVGVKYKLLKEKIT